MTLLKLKSEYVLHLVEYERYKPKESELISNMKSFVHVCWKKGSSKHNI